MQVDVVAGEVEAEARRLPHGGFDVVDGGGQGHHHRVPQDRAGDDAGSDRRAGAIEEGVGFELRLRALFRRLRVDGQPDRKVDVDRFQRADRFFRPSHGRRNHALFVFDDELREAFRRVAGGLFEELRVEAVDVAGGRIGVAGPRLPAAVRLRVDRIRRGDDRVRIGPRRWGQSQHGQDRDRHDQDSAQIRLAPHLLLLSPQQSVEPFYPILMI